MKFTTYFILVFNVIYKSTTSFECANRVAGLSKIIAEKIYLGKNHKHIYNLYYIEIPDLVVRKPLDILQPSYSVSGLIKR
jgi:hypothetical protein